MHDLFIPPRVEIALNFTIIALFLPGNAMRWKWKRIKSCKEKLFEMEKSTKKCWQTFNISAAAVVHVHK